MEKDGPIDGRKYNIKIEKKKHFSMAFLPNFDFPVKILNYTIIAKM